MAAARGEAERAARLYGATAALREQLGAAVVPWERLVRERPGRGPSSPRAGRVRGAWAAGAVLPLEAAVAEALTDDASGGLAGTAPARRTPPRPWG